MEEKHEDDRPGAEGCPLSRRGLAGGLAGLAVTAPILGFGPMTAAADNPQTGADGALQVGPRFIDVPKTISAEAQAFLAKASARMGPNAPAPPPNPPIEDKAAWRAYIAAMDKFLDPMTDRILAKGEATVERSTMGGAAVAVATPKSMRHPDRARISIHGGAWTVGGGRHVDGDSAKAASDSGCRTYSVDYRMPPDHPFPAALEDCLSTYREVIKLYDPKKVVVSGISSGGNLCAATILRIRDIGLPMPAAAVILTPVSDLSQGSDSWSTNMGIDPIVTRHTYAQNALYTAGHDIKDPYLSPVRGDFAKGFPPVFLQSGTRDILLSDTVLLHQALLKAGVEAELHVWEAMPHAGFGGDTPEDREIAERIERFIAKHLA
jgi:acetyl esterase/lipase